MLVTFWDLPLLIISLHLKMQIQIEIILKAEVAS